LVKAAVRKEAISFVAMLGLMKLSPPSTVWTASRSSLEVLVEVK
jgi:hypothetical protein